MIDVPDLVMKNGMKVWNMPLAHSDGVFWGKTKLRSLKGKLGRNAVPTFGPDLVMDDTH